MLKGSADIIICICAIFIKQNLLFQLIKILKCKKCSLIMLIILTKCANIKK